MNIRTYPIIDKNVNVKTNYRKINQPNRDEVTFSGHFGAEAYDKNLLGYVIKETGFFRDLETKNFVCDYIKKTFANKDKIKILIGGCSTGEELHTYNMLLKDLSKKTEYIGFDVDAESIKQAKSNIFLMQKLKPVPNEYVDVSSQYKRTLQDSFLAFEDQGVLTDKQRKLKELFDEYFIISGDKPKLAKKSLALKIHLWFLKWVKIYPPEFENKNVILNDEKAKNCKFVVGDMQDLDAITKGEPVDVITFTNALYHLLTEHVKYNNTRRLHANAYRVFDELAAKLKKNLSPSGIFVLGEEEKLQLMDDELVSTIMKQHGFIPLNKTKLHDANVWQKVV